MLSRFSRVWPFETPWTIAHQVPLSVRFSRQDFWSGFPCPPPGELPDPGLKPMSLMSPAMACGFFTTSTAWEAPFLIWLLISVFSSSLILPGTTFLFFHGFCTWQKIKVLNLGGKSKKGSHLARLFELKVCRFSALLFKKLPQCPGYQYT